MNDNRIITRTGRTIASLKAMQYTPEQQAVIDKELARTATDKSIYAGCRFRTTLMEYDTKIEYKRSEKLIQRGPNVYALFGPYATQVIDVVSVEGADGSWRYEHFPVIVNGQCFEQFVEGAIPGLMILMRQTKNNGQPCNDGWIVDYAQTRFAQHGRNE